MTNRSLYRRHLEILDGYLTDSLQRASRKGLALDGVVFHAGREAVYHRDDELIAFHPDPYFARYVPLAGTENVVLARPGRKPLVVRVAPRDFWYEVPPVAPSYWQDEVEFTEVTSLTEVTKVTGPLTRVAFVGGSGEAAAELGIAGDLVEPAALMAPMDWHRATKTDHEVALVEEAAKLAAEGHRVARKAFEAGLNEKEIHWAYLQATNSLEREMPFPTIVAIDDKTAFLHYPGKRTAISTSRHTFMLDAGAAWEGYASDITRTWLRADADPVFKALLEGVDVFQRGLVDLVTAGRPFPELHFEAHRRVGHLLAETGVVKGSAERAVEQGITRTFLPHGLGHHLGAQVHDVGGRQLGPDGGTNAPPPGHEALRNTRILEPGHLVTIEPGLYFIPMLLDQLKAGPAATLLDWKLVDRLTPLGGIRIEDDVLCTPTGPRDLTRSLIQGPRGV